jgi:hypothetical protein
MSDEFRSGAVFAIQDSDSLDDSDEDSGVGTSTFDKMVFESKGPADDLSPLLTSHILDEARRKCSGSAERGFRGG